MRVLSLFVLPLTCFFFFLFFITKQSHQQQQQYTNNNTINSNNTNNEKNENNNTFFYFVQLTDIHIEYISSFNNTEINKLKLDAINRYKDYKLLTKKVLPFFIKPKFTIVTGDLTHAIPSNPNKYFNFTINDNFINKLYQWITKKINLNVPIQFLDQWKFYNKYSKISENYLNNNLNNNLDNLQLIYPKFTDISNLRWFEIPGNHDVFGVGNKLNKNEYLFLNYSLNGNKLLNDKNSFYIFDYKINKNLNKKIRFILIDGSPIIGSYRPINFFGSFNTKSFKTLQKILRENTKNNEIIQTLMFGHYPLSMIPIVNNFNEKENDTWIDFCKEFKIKSYFSGHLHNMFGFISKMRTIMPISNHLEIETMDFKDNRNFKVIAIENKYISFLDVNLLKLNNTPAVFITYPKDCAYLTNVEMISEEEENYNFIRILGFYPYGLSDNENILVDVMINDSILIKKGLEIVKGKTEYKIPFNYNNNYKKGLHKLNILYNNENIYEHYFTFDYKNNSVMDQCGLFRSSNEGDSLLKSFISNFGTEWILTKDWKFIFYELFNILTWSTGFIIILLFITFRNSIIKGCGKLSFTVDFIYFIIYLFSMRYGLWFIGELSPLQRMGGLLNLKYFYFNSQPMNSVEENLLVEFYPFSLLSNLFSKVLMIDDSTIYFRLVYPTFILTYLPILFGFLIIYFYQYQIKIKNKINYIQGKGKYLLFTLFGMIILFNFLSFKHFYPMFVRSYGFFVILTAFNNIHLPLYGYYKLVKYIRELIKYKPKQL